MSNNEQNSYFQYLNKLNDIEFIELKRKREETSRYRKFRQVKVMLKHDWAQFKANTYNGALSGAVLGLVLSLPLFIKHRQISIVVISVVMTGGFFGTISGVGSLMKHEDLELAKAKLDNREFVGCDF